MPAHRPAEIRFWEKVNKTDTCWLWTAQRTTGGYGVFRIRNPRAQTTAHRVAWEMAHGPIPDGLNVCHHCDTPSCVRPDHLFLGTQRENLRDMTVKGRRYRRIVTHCKHGHPFDATNTYVRPTGGRACRECGRAKDLRYKSRHGT